MKSQIRWVVFGMAYLLCAGLVCAQTENAENKVPPTRADYEYLAPQSLSDFMTALKEAGKRGFRFYKMTTVPVSLAEEEKKGKKKKKEVVLAGVLKYEGGSRYDYNFFFAEGEENPDATLNKLSNDGWHFREVLSVMSGKDRIDLPVGGAYANRARILPALGNLYLLERVDGQPATPRVYKLFKAGVGTGRTPTAKLQAMLDQSLKEGFLPVGAYLTIDLKNLFSIDAASAILVEKREAEKNFEYKFVRGNQSDGLWEDIEALAKQGFRIKLMNYNTAIMHREPGDALPVSYTHLRASDEKFQSHLAATLAKNPQFYGTAAYGDGLWMKLNKNSLIFENLASAGNEYKFVNVLPLIPKQYRKNPAEFAKTLENPQTLFSRAEDEGFTPCDLYYSDSEGLVIVFERGKKQ
jgi:hypothetical protein